MRTGFTTNAFSKEGDGSITSFTFKFTKNFEGKFQFIVCQRNDVHMLFKFICLYLIYRLLHVILYKFGKRFYLWIIS